MKASDLVLPAGVILAGGRSSRMGGRDKALCPLNGATLAERCTSRLRPQVAALAVNANGDAGSFAFLGLPVLPDPVADYPGPLGGILAALDWAGEEGKAVVTVAVDTPFFPADLVARLTEAGQDRVAVAASGGSLHRVFTLWPCGLKDELRRFLATAGTGRVLTFLERVGFEAVEFPMLALPLGPFDPFFNINTPADLVRAEKLAAELP